MYSAKEELDQLKKTYQQEKISQGIKSNLINRYLIEEQRFTKKLKRKRRIKRGIFSFALITLIVSSVLFNHQVRSFAKDLPIIGPVVKLIVGETLSDEKINIRVPQISMDDEQENETIHGLNKKYFHEGQEAFEKAKIQYQNFQTEHMQITGDYQKVLDDSRFLVIERNLTQTAADSYTEKKFDTIDKKNGVVLSLPLLFKDNSYYSVLTNEVKAQMKKKVKENANNYYWTEADFKDGGVKEVPLITKNSQFYINEKHELVLVYEQFAIAPGYMGTPEFVIPKSVTKNILASKDYLNN